MNRKHDSNDIPLLDLFFMETGRQCVTLNQQMAIVAGGQGAQVDYSELHRALHSIKGAARIIDLKPIVELIQAMEDALRPPPDLGRINHNLWLTFKAGVEELNQITTLQADQVRPVVKQNKKLLKKLINNLRTDDAAVSRSADSRESPAGPADDRKNEPPATTKFGLSPYAPKNLFEIFKEDAQDHLNLLSDNIIKLERTPNDSFLIEESMRAAHSLKGAARIIKLYDIVRLAHGMEDILVELQSNSSSLTPEVVDNLLAGCDILKNLTQINAGELAKWLQENNPAIIDVLSRLTTTSAVPLKTASVDKDKTAGQTSRKQALKIDPNFKLAWIGLAQAYINNYWSYGGNPADREKARESIDKAIAIDPDFPELYMAEGFYHYWGLLDYDTAIKNLQCFVSGTGAGRLFQ